MLVFANNSYLPMSSLTVFGKTEKSEDDQSTYGRYGTGMNYALSVLLRNGADVTIIRSAASHELETLTAGLDETGQAYLHSDLQQENISLPFTDNLGRDWELWMAERELAMNAMDEPGGELHTFTDSYEHMELPPVRERLKNWPETATPFTVIIVSYKEKKSRSFTAFPASPMLLSKDWKRDNADKVSLSNAEGDLYNLPSHIIYCGGIPVHMLNTEDEALKYLPDINIEVAYLSENRTIPTYYNAVRNVQNIWVSSENDMDILLVMAKTLDVGLESIMSSIVERSTDFCIKLLREDISELPESFLTKLLVGHKRDVAMAAQFEASREIEDPTIKLSDSMQERLAAARTSEFDNLEYLQDTIAAIHKLMKVAQNGRT